ncbi:MAG: SGNH/GDSL hydrolase family protein [Actinomycetota bacterium]|jgi:hypothetical protein
MNRFISRNPQRSGRALGKLPLLKFAALPLAVLALSGCNTVMIGDSIFNMSRSELGGFVDAADGRGADNAGLNGNPLTGREAIASLAPAVSANGWLVIDLGTNDARSTETTDAFRGFVRETVEGLADDRCLAWVVPYNPHFPENSAQIESALRDEIVAQPCHALIEWGPLVHADPSLTVDGIHPTADGKQELAAMIAAATS